MSDFLFHKVSEDERRSIKREAKRIMDSFSKKLEKVDEKISEPLIERDDFEREEGKSKSEVKELIQMTERDEFKKRILENAPVKNNDFIIAEKKKWE